MHIILEHNGFTFASDGMDYVVLDRGQVVFRDMDKGLVEKDFFRRACGTEPYSKTHIFNPKMHVSE